MLSIWVMLMLKGFCNTGWNSIRLAGLDWRQLKLSTWVDIKLFLSSKFLNVWLRIGSPNPHFTYEFERLICRKLPKHLCSISEETVNEAKPPAVGLDRPIKAETTATVLTSAEENKQTPPTQKPDEPNLEKTFNHAKDSSEKTIENNLSLISSWGSSYESNWSEFSEGNKMIHQFIPLPDVSTFFNRLKTFGEEKLEGQ